MYCMLRDQLPQFMDGGAAELQFRRPRASIAQDTLTAFSRLVGFGITLGLSQRSQTGSVLPAIGPLFTQKFILSTSMRWVTLVSRIHSAECMNPDRYAINLFRSERNSGTSGRRMLGSV